MLLFVPSPTALATSAHDSRGSWKSATCALSNSMRQATIALVTAAAVFTAPHVTISPSLAISGGGLDYAGGSFEGTDFSGGSYEEKDFSGSKCRGASFVGANLRRTRFFNADLRDVDMTKADLAYSTVERAVLRDAILHDTVLTGSYISESILDAKDISGADFTDALIAPATTVRALCERPDINGVNATTGVSTKESLMCPN